MKRKFITTIAALLFVMLPNAFSESFKFYNLPSKDFCNIMNLKMVEENRCELIENEELKSFIKDFFGKEMFSRYNDVPWFKLDYYGSSIELVEYKDSNATISSYDVDSCIIYGTLYGEYSSEGYYGSFKGIDGNTYYLIALGYWTDITVFGQKINKYLFIDAMWLVKSKKDLRYIIQYLSSKDE